MGLHIGFIHCWETSKVLIIPLLVPDDHEPAFLCSSISTHARSLGTRLHNVSCYIRKYRSPCVRHISSFTHHLIDNLSTNSETITSARHPGMVRNQTFDPWSPRFIIPGPRRQMQILEERLASGVARSGNSPFPCTSSMAELVKRVRYADHLCLPLRFSRRKALWAGIAMISRGIRNSRLSILLRAFAEEVLDVACPIYCRQSCPYVCVQQFQRFYKTHAR
jgi:hypothetical protein